MTWYEVNYKVHGQPLEEFAQEDDPWQATLKALEYVDMLSEDMDIASWEVLVLIHECEDSCDCGEPEVYARFQGDTIE